MSRSSRSTTTGIATDGDLNVDPQFGFVEAVGPLQQGLRRTVTCAALNRREGRSSRSTTTGIATGGRRPI